MLYRGTADTRCMRYSEDTIQFFGVGLKLFGVRFVRFMTGMKNFRPVLTQTDLNRQEAS